MKARITTMGWAILLGVCLPACSSDDSGGDGDGGSATVDAGDGDGPSAGEEIGPDGGEISLGGVTLTIPAGALEEPVEIEVFESSERAEGKSSLTYRFEPEGLEFLAAAELSIDTNLDPGRLAIFTGDPEGRRYPLATETGGGKSTASIYHFSQFWLEHSERGASFCPRPTTGVPESLCTETGKNEHVAYGITETGTGTQPAVSIQYTNLTDDLIILEWFEVRDGVNVSSNVFENERLDDFTSADGQLLRPMNYGSSDWAQKVTASMEDRKDFWRYVDMSHWVAPADDSQPMSFTFCLGYRFADGPTEPELCFDYGDSSGDAGVPDAGTIEPGLSSLEVELFWSIASPASMSPHPDELAGGRTAGPHDGTVWLWEGMLQSCSSSGKFLCFNDNGGGPTGCGEAGCNLLSYARWNGTDDGTSAFMDHVQVGIHLLAQDFKVGTLDLPYVANTPPGDFDADFSYIRVRYDPPFAEEVMGGFGGQVPAGTAAAFPMESDPGRTAGTLTIEELTPVLRGTFTFEITNNAYGSETANKVWGSFHIVR